MLRKDYRYISFDFETTGLDTTKDEPLQIGIVEFDHECNIIRTFQSLIKPVKPISELKEIVRYVTGFKLEDLEDAPSYESLLGQISEFFDEKTVIVGQNIGFDLAFLNRLLPDFIPVAQIDTFHWSKITWHFQPSYALDVIAQMLLKKGLIDTSIISGTDQAHDALHDSLTTLAVRKATLKHIHTIRRKYLLVDYCIQRNEGIFSTLLQRTPKDYKFDEKELFFPPLKKNIPPERSLVQDTQSTPKIQDFEKSVIDLSGGSLSQFLECIDRTAKQRIIAVNSRSKATCIKKWFDSNYLAHTSLQSNAIFDPQRIDLLLHQDALTDSEIGFIIKYYSHHLQGNSTMDLNTTHEYMIFDVLTSRSIQTKRSTIITTHDQIIGVHHEIVPENSHLLFLDNDRWIQSLQRKASEAFDMYEILKIVERNVYEMKLLGNHQAYEAINIYENQLTVFFGVVGNALNELFKGYAQNQRSCDFLVEDTRFQGIQALRERVLTATHELDSWMSPSQYTLISDKISRLEELITGPCEVEKKMYHGDKRHYVLKSRDPYLDREELISRLPQIPMTFVSLKTGESSQRIAFTTSPKRPQILNISQLGPLDQFLDGNTGNCFIFSGAKHISQSVFKHRIGKNYQEKYTIVGENITGGTGKNLYLAQKGATSNIPLLAIGGYHFFMALTEKNFAFPSICMYYSKGTMTPQIITDFVWWSR